MSVTLKDFRTEYLYEEVAHLDLKGFYQDLSPAWQVYSPEGEPLMTPTVCMMEYGITPAEGNVIIKDYSENEGVLYYLEQIGLLERVKEHPAGYTTVWECKVLKNQDILLRKER